MGLAIQYGVGCGGGKLRPRGVKKDFLKKNFTFPGPPPPKGPFFWPETHGGGGKKKNKKKNKGPPQKIPLKVFFFFFYPKKVPKNGKKKKHADWGGGGFFFLKAIGGVFTTIRELNSKKKQAPMGGWKKPDNVFFPKLWKKTKKNDFSP